MSETAGVTFTKKYTPIRYFEKMIRKSSERVVFMNINVPVNSTDKIVLILLAVLAVIAVRIVISFFKPDKPKAGAKPHRRSAKAAGLTEVIVGIDGMMCGMCEAHIKDAIRGQFPQAKGLSASHVKGQAIFYLPEQLTTEAIAEALHAGIDPLGYTVGDVIIG